MRDKEEWKHKHDNICSNLDHSWCKIPRFKDKKEVMTAADWCSRLVSPAEENKMFAFLKKHAHISLCKQRRRSAVNVLTFPVPGDGCHDVERGHSWRRERRKNTTKNQRGQKQMLPCCYAAWWMNKQPNILHLFMSVSPSIVFFSSLQLFVNSWTERASWITKPQQHSQFFTAASAAVVTPGIPTCTERREGGRGRQMWWGIQTQEEKRC